MGSEVIYNPKQLKTRPSMETVKTAMFETLIESAVPDGEGGFIFTLEGKTYHIKDTLEISKIAQAHGYIIIY
jgi:16S rRNA G966 N2-methylase RsmD